MTNDLRNNLARTWRCVVSFTLFLLLIPAVYAACPVPQIRANAEFFKRDAVFTAKVLSQKYARGPGEYGWYHRVQVTNSFKGVSRRELVVYSQDTSIRFPLEIGREYLLFADRQHNVLQIDACGNSALMAGASESLRAIQGIASATDSEIEGWLAPETSGVNLAGIHVVIRSGSHVYRVTTDKDGRFYFRAPVGSYTVDFGNHEYYVNAGDVFWYDPDHFVLHPGETAALQLVSVRHPKS